jgi:hypothetical protein
MQLRTFKPALVWSILFILCIAVIQALPASALDDPADETTVETVDTTSTPTDDSLVDDSLADDTVTETDATVTDDTVTEESDDDVEGTDTETDTETEGTEDESGESKPHHGAAVRVAAHCPVRGRAHGQLVRSVAHDKSATPETAQAACDALLAELDASEDSTVSEDGTEDDQTTHEQKHEKKAKPEKSSKSKGKGGNGK